MNDPLVQITHQITQTVTYGTTEAFSRFVTITGFSHYHGLEPFAIGQFIRCRKEPANPFDSDAIRAFLPVLGTVGYLANSAGTKAGGTMGASRIYEHVPDRFYVRVQFTTRSKVICRVEDGPLNRLDAELAQQLAEQDDWG